MNRDNERQSAIILSVIGIIPVVWLALLIAPSVKGGLPEILPSLLTAFNNPFHIELCEDSNSCLRYERYRFCRQRPDYRSQQSVRFYLRSYPCHRSYPAWLRYRSGRSLFEVSRPVSESQRFPDSCGRYHHHLCKGNPDPYYRLKEHSYQTGHTWHFRYAPNLKGGANR